MQGHTPENIATAILDSFMHPSLRTDADNFFRVRILIAAMLSFTAVALGAFLIVMLVHFPLRSIILAALILLPAATWFITLLTILRKKGRYLFCSISTVLVLLAMIATGISVSGGPAVSPVLQLLVIPPLTAYFFGGIRWGNYTVVIAFSVLLLLIGLHFAGVPFIQTVEEADRRIALQFLVSFVNLSVISGMAFIYEYTAAILKRERDMEHEKYMTLAKTDALTGLANRRNFDAMLLERIEAYAAVSPPRRFVLGYLDLDGFKPINDQYGHGVGDEVLREISARLRAALRGSDFVGRHGGDEFMLMLDHVQDAASLEIMAQRLLASIAKPIESSAGSVRVSGSLGFAMFPNDSDEIETLKKAADTAMYAAKKQRGSWCLYQPGM